MPQGRKKRENWLLPLAESQDSTINSQTIYYIASWRKENESWETVWTTDAKLTSSLSVGPGAKSAHPSCKCMHFLSANLLASLALFILVCVCVHLMHYLLWTRRRKEHEEQARTKRSNYFWSSDSVSGRIIFTSCSEIGKFFEFTSARTFIWLRNNGMFNAFFFLLLAALLHFEKKGGSKWPFLSPKFILICTFITPGQRGRLIAPVLASLSHLTFSLFFPLSFLPLGMCTRIIVEATWVLLWSPKCKFIYSTIWCHSYTFHSPVWATRVHTFFASAKWKCKMKAPERKDQQVNNSIPRADFIFALSTAKRLQIAASSGWTQFFGAWKITRSNFSCNLHTFNCIYYLMKQILYKCHFETAANDVDQSTSLIQLLLNPGIKLLLCLSLCTWVNVWHKCLPKWNDYQFLLLKFKDLLLISLAFIYCPSAKSSTRPLIHPLQLYFLSLFPRLWQFSLH